MSRPVAQAAQIAWPMLAAFLGHLVLLALYLAPLGWDLSALACVGEERLHLGPYQKVTVGFPKFGYDGQFCYAIAQAPWSRFERDVVDVPSVRQLRILYPLLGWLLTGGHATLLFWVLPLINLAAIAGLAGLGAWLALRHGLSSWWGFWLPVAVNAGLPALRDLTDNLSTLALGLLLAAWLLRAGAWSIALAGAAAVFCREQNLLVLLLVMGAAILNQRRDVAVGLASVMTGWAAWVMILRLEYADWPFRASNLSLPGSGMIELLRTAQSHRLLHGAAMLHLALMMGLAIGLMRCRGSGVVKAMTLAGALLACTGSYAIYASPWSYARVFTWLPLGLWLLSLQTRQTWIAGVTAAGGFWPLVVLLQTYRGA